MRRPRSQPDIVRVRKDRSIPTSETPGVGLSLLVPDPSARADWEAVILPLGAKERLARQAAMTFLLRQRVPHTSLPLHGVIGLFGPPGTGKTTLARGLADAVARLLKGLGQFLLVQIDAHALSSAALGRSQKAVDALFRDQVPQWADEGPVVLLIDEIETVAADRARLSLEANPIDVHRASDAALVGLDHLGRNYPNVIVIVTSNFLKAVDAALLSRIDVKYETPLPGAEAVEAIFRDTLGAVAAAFPGAAGVADSPRFKEAVAAAVGLDGRRIRKVVAAACSIDPATGVDPGKLTIENLLAAIEEAKA